MKILFILILAVISSSCGKENVEYCYNVYLHNETSFQVEVEAFHNRKLIKTIVLPKKKSKAFLITESDYDFNTTIFGDTVDSLNIKFDNEKMVTQYCNGVAINNCGDGVIFNNLVDYKDGTRGTKTKLFKEDGCKVYKKEFNFIIDESDYKRAVPIKK